MKRHTMRTAKATLVAMALLPAALATSPAEQVTRLGKDLTPTGAEKAGNADGSIPEWTGGITQAPPGFQKTDRFRKDPFSDEKPILTLDASNADQYREFLSPAQLERLKRYPTFKMLVYPTHRSAAYPAEVYENTKINATHARLAKNGNGIEDAVMGVPFPIPQNGNQVIWNHLFRFRGHAVDRKLHVAAVNPDGTYTMGRIESSLFFAYNSRDNRLLYYRSKITAPARLAGTAFVVHEPINQEAETRSAWVYAPGLRRVKRVSSLGYDTPFGDGLLTNDQVDLFNGDTGWYSWKLIGKQELYVPYNCYRLQSPDTDAAKVLLPKHLNGDYLRYEKHRVWKVEATINPGHSHLYPKRVFYVDEDSWSALVIDQYDRDGHIWRMAEGYPIAFYDVPAIWWAGTALYDLQSGKYTLVDFNTNQTEKGYEFSATATADDFSPGSLGREGTR